MSFTNVSSIQSGVWKKKNHLIYITMSNFRSVSVPTSQRPSSSIGSGTRILIPIHLLRCERCHHSDWITENDHCMSGGSPQSDCSWLSRDIYDSIFLLYLSNGRDLLVRRLHDFLLSRSDCCGLFWNVTSTCPPGLNKHLWI